MKRHSGGEPVRGGYYWNLTRWEIVTVGGDSGALPTPPTDRYLSVPLPLLFLAAPFLGGVYVICLPFIGFAMFAWGIGCRLGLVGHKAVGEMAATLGTDWAPGAAYLAGKPDEKGQETEAGTSALSDLQKEIDEKRR